PEPLPRAQGELHGPELRGGHGHRRSCDQPEGAGPGQRRGMGGAHQRAATGGGQTMNTKTMKAVYGFALWLAGIGLALAQSNSIESFEVSQQAGKTIVRIKYAFSEWNEEEKKLLDDSGNFKRWTAAQIAELSCLPV